MYPIVNMGLYIHTNYITKTHTHNYRVYQKESVS